MIKRRKILLILIPLLYVMWDECVFSLLLDQGFSVNKFLLSMLAGLFLYWCGQWNRNRRLAFRIQSTAAMIFTAIYGAQLAYYTLFETPFYLKSISGAGDTMTDFFDVVVNAVVDVAPGLALMLLAVVLWYTFYRKNFLAEPYSERRGFYTLLAFTGWTCMTICSVILDYDGPTSASYMMLYEFVPTESVREFGMLTTAFLDIKYNIFHLQTTRPETVRLDMDEIDVESTDSGLQTDETPTQTADASGTESSEEGTTAAQIKSGHEDTEASSLTWSSDEYNVIEDLDFDKEENKPEEEQDETYADMNAYFSALTPSKKNEYTGMFEGKNLILITAEGFSKFAISKDLTPTLYKLTHEGFTFDHFYTPIWGVSTSDGEFVATTGLLPKAGVWSYTEIADNYMPFAFGTQFRDLGYQALAFHNHSYTYYNRNLSYPNMGYDFYSKGHGLDITDTWPESDVEMIEQSVPMYAESGEPFHVYYMTVSGHLEYDWDENYISTKNRSRVENLDYSDSVKAYLACQLELEDALTELIEELDEAGVLDDTVIALSPDHYPYGLTTDEYKELRGEDFDTTFGLYESTFILWNSQMTEPVSVDTYCSSLDIAPTLSNLFGLEYDSRLYIGTDIFGDISPIVCFQDRSFITDRIMYDNTNQKIIQLDNGSITEEYLAEASAAVKNKFYYSAEIIENDYYRYLFDQ